jgi:hypothetical protein
MATGPGEKIQRLNLKGFTPTRRKNIKEPEVALRWDSKLGIASILATPLFEAACLEAKVGHTRAPWLEIGLLSTDPNALVGTPTTTENEATIQMIWDEGRNLVSLDMQLVLLAKQLTLSKHSSAHVPITCENVDGTGRKIVFHFDKISYEPVKPRKKGADGQSQQPNTDTGTETNTK